MKKTQTMYRGSSVPEVSTFEPQEVAEADIGKLHNKGITATKVVWASPLRHYALPFGALFGKVRFSLRHKPNEFQRLFIQDSNAQEKLDLDSKVYFYTLQDGNFIQLNGAEWISLEPVDVVDSEEYTLREVFSEYEVYVSKLWDTGKL